MGLPRSTLDIAGRIKSDRHAILFVVEPILIAQPRCEILFGNLVLLLLVRRCVHYVVIHAGHFNFLVASLAPKAIQATIPFESVELAIAETTFWNWRNGNIMRNLTCSTHRSNIHYGLSVLSGRHKRHEHWGEGGQGD